MNFDIRESDIITWEDEIRQYNIHNEESNMIYQLDPNTQLKLQQTVDFLFTNALKNDYSITANLIDIQNNDMRLVGLDNRLKGRDRIKEKIYSKNITHGKSLYDLSNAIHDVLRYTFVIEDEKYSENVIKCMELLNDYDYEIIDFKNLWGDKFYQGINIKIKNEFGFIFEIQFHSKSGYKINEGNTRELYKVLRSKNAPKKIAAHANTLRMYYQSKIIIPLGAKDITIDSFAKRNIKK